MARQATAHRRGGTHKVRDEDRTDSVYDTYNYKELLDATKERRLYRKDMKKVEMAWALKRNDEAKRRTERDNLNALRRKQEEARKEEERIAAEKQELINARQRKKLEKKRKRERDESVSDDTLSDTEIEAERETRDEYKREAIGQALSDSSWDSTSTESLPNSIDHLAPLCTLRLLEWPYETLPCTIPSSSPFHFQPRTLPYVPLRLVTTLTKQKLFLPGHKYPPAIPPDYVPMLSQPVRAAAHRGQLSGLLRKATIETGVQWALRTLIQPSTAHMYFLPCAANSTKSLADVYQKWEVESSKARRVRGRSEACANDRDVRVGQRKRIKTGLVAEVYEACKWRPAAVGYVPAFLDFGAVCTQREEGPKTLDNLRYVRFPGCDVPHYYFWVRDAETNRHDEKGETLGVKRDETGVCVEGVVREETRYQGAAGKYPRKTIKDSRTHQACISESCADEEPDESLHVRRAGTRAGALYRRASATSMPDQEQNPDQRILDWLDQISPSFGLPPPHHTVSDEEDTRRFWQETVPIPPSSETADECPFCCLPWHTMTCHVRVLNCSLLQMCEKQS